MRRAAVYTGVWGFKGAVKPENITFMISLWQIYVCPCEDIRFLTKGCGENMLKLNEEKLNTGVYAIW